MVSHTLLLYFLTTWDVGKRNEKHWRKSGNRDSGVYKSSRISRQDWGRCRDRLRRFCGCGNINTKKVHQVRRFRLSLSFYTRDRHILLGQKNPKLQTIQSECIPRIKSPFIPSTLCRNNNHRVIEVLSDSSDGNVATPKPRTVPVQRL